MKEKTVAPSLGGDNMVESIERIERVKGINYDVGRREREDGSNEDSSGKKFSDYLKKASKKAPEKSAEIGDAYKLDVGRPSHSLFYEGNVDFRAIRRNLSAYL